MGEVDGMTMQLQKQGWGGRGHGSVGKILPSSDPRTRGKDDKEPVTPVLESGEHGDSWGLLLPI